MHRLRRIRAVVGWPVIAAMLVFSMPLGTAQAALVGTDRVIEQAEVQADRASVVAYLAREDVRRQFTARGVDPDEASARVASLSDAEVSRIAERIDGMPAGQGALGTIVTAVVVVAFVLLITDLTGLTDVYPFINSMR